MGTQPTFPAESAACLGEWTLSSLVNRTDVSGLWTGEGWSTCKETLTRSVIEEHYLGNSIIGVHAVSIENCCRFMVFDVDSHGDDPGAAHEMADRVRAFLEASGIPYLEEDSDGRGGRHFWVRFAEKQPAAVVCRIIQKIKAASRIQEAEPVVPLYAGISCEIFPKGERTAETPFGGGYIRLPGKHPKHDHWSRFLIGGQVLTGQEAIQAWLTLPCVETRVLARIGEGLTQKKTEEDRREQRSTDEHTNDLCNPLCPSVYERIEEAILKSQPLEERQRNKRLFRFSRMLAGIPECHDWTLRQWRPYVKKWHQVALPVIGTKPFDDTWSDFIRSHDKVKVPYDRDLMAGIFESIPPDYVDKFGLDYESPITGNLIRLCVGLDKHRDGGVFFLSCRVAGAVCGVSHKSAADGLNVLVEDDVLLLVKPGCQSGKAARYQLNPKFSTCDRSKQ